MAKTFRTYLPEQNLLLPASLREWLPDDHLSYFVSDVVDQLDLSAIESVYEGEDRGQPPYHPRMMTKILLYGYCVGVFSSTRIQKRLVEDVAFRVLAAGNEPDFRTISDFRKLHLKALEELFQQMLRLTLETGMMKLGRVALDGSKVKGNASKHKAMSYGRMKETEKRLREEVRKLLNQAEAATKKRIADTGGIGGATNYPKSCSGGKRGSHGSGKPSTLWKSEHGSKPRARGRIRRKPSRPRRRNTTLPIPSRGC
jgi:transposase